MTSSGQGLHVARRIYAAAFAAFVLLPLVAVFIASFTSANYVQFPPAAWGIKWYFEVFNNRALMNGLLFSLQIAAAVALISGALGVAAAFGIVRGVFLGRDLIVGLLMAPLAIPHVVLAIAFLQFFAFIGIQTSPWGLCIGHVLITLPYVLRLTLASLQDFNRVLERASESLGATQWETFRFVTLPIIAPGVVAGVLFAFLLSFDEATLSVFMSLPNKTTLPAVIFGIATTGVDPTLTAASSLLIIVATGFVFLIERYFGILNLLAGGKV